MYSIEYIAPKQMYLFIFLILILMSKYMFYFLSYFSICTYVKGRTDYYVLWIAIVNINTKEDYLLTLLTLHLLTVLLKSCTHYACQFGKLSSGHRTGKGQFHSNPKEGQCQRMLKLPYSCTHFTCKKSNAQSSSS